MADFYPLVGIIYNLKYKKWKGEKRKTGMLAMFALVFGLRSRPLEDVVE